MQKTLVPIDRADKGGEASTIRKADDAATEKERAENIEGNRFAFPRVFRQKYHSSIGRFLHALHGNAKNSLSSQREIPLETLGKREQKPNPFGLCRVQQGFILEINPVSRFHRQREET